MLKKKNFIINNFYNFFIYHDFHKHITISFYKFFYISNPRKIFFLLQNEFKKYNISGRIYISTEGINAQISFPLNNYYEIIFFLKNLHIGLNDLFINHSFYQSILSFKKLQIKLKKQIISRNLMCNGFLNTYTPGIYINALEVNNYFLNDNAIFVDVRNTYEYEIGHFSNSINIPSITFKNQLHQIKKILLPYKEKKIIMYCTGGIRCEISTTLLKSYGFLKVYQIYGGVLGYLNQVKEYNLPVYFKGQLFVFDDRLSIPITFDSLSICKNCGAEVYRPHINCVNPFCHILFLQCYRCSLILKSFCSQKCKVFTCTEKIS